MRKKTGRVGEQLELVARTWGGRRRGAGRPSADRRSCEPHRKRPQVTKRCPQHVVQRVVPALAGLRRRTGYAAIDRALRAVIGRADFRVVHVSIQRTHLHLLVEADDERSLAIASPRQARNGLAYVLNNWRRHREDRGAGGRIDRYSSAIAFDGWKGIGGFVVPARYTPLAVAKPKSWLLREGWMRGGGAIDPHEVPGPSR